MLLFLPFALGAFITALLVVLNSNPVRSALFLVLNLFCIAVLYLLLNAYFLAVVQVIVYAGAIMVLFLFVIMLLNLGTPDRTPDRLKGQLPLSLLGGGMLGGALLWTIAKGVPVIPMAVEPVVKGHLLGTPHGIGFTLYDPQLPWLFPFEVTSILLLIAVIGSVVLARRTHGTEAKAS